MIPEKCNVMIAWKIAYELMIRSREPLTLFMLHPGGGQYDCLALLESVRGRFAPKMLITLSGDSIHLGNVSLQHYADLYRMNRDRLFKRIATDFGLYLSEQPIRDCLPMTYLMELNECANICVKPAWYDGSDRSALESEARAFTAYPNKDSAELSVHVPWWLILYREKVVAALNLMTGCLITSDNSTSITVPGRDIAMTALISAQVKAELQNVIEETQLLLRSNDEWVDRYVGYASAIMKSADFIRDVRASFREWAPLKFYLNTTSVKKASRKIRFEVRYLGQTVATLSASNGKGHHLSTAGCDNSNMQHFNCSHQLRQVEWDSPDAAKFRRFFKGNPEHQITNGIRRNNEHRVESMWLTELAKTSRKALPYVKPVMIGNVRFPMPTPIRASDHDKIKYSGAGGGGIDILARTGTGGPNTNLLIMELKDENIKREPPKEALKQAVAYTTFIHALLRSKAGDAWWKLFGFGGAIPEHLVLYAACVMPSSDCNDYSFKDMRLEVDHDTIKLHYVYFTEENNRIKQVDSSL